MGKNQHVTPHKDGGWQVKGEIIRGQQLGQILRHRLLSELEKLHAGKSRNFSFMEGMVEYEKGTHMGMIHFRRRDNFK